MNRHFMGCGATLDAVSGLKVWRDWIPSSERMVHVYSKWTPLIINDKLHLSNRRSFKWIGDFQQTSYFLDQSANINICGHLHSLAWSRENPKPANLHVLRECVNQLGHCKLCPTDYEITVHSKENWLFGQTTHVTLTSFMQIGSCRSLDDWNWVLCSTGWKQLRASGIATRETRGIPPGEIRDTWYRNQRTEISGQCLKRWLRDTVAYIDGILP
jgi:hypothetical protein